jgi:hypothetical protein
MPSIKIRRMRQGTKCEFAAKLTPRVLHVSIPGAGRPVLDPRCHANSIASVGLSTKPLQVFALNEAILQQIHIWCPVSSNFAVGVCWIMDKSQWNFKQDCQFRFSTRAHLVVKLGEGFRTDVLQNLFDFKA